MRISSCQSSAHVLHIGNCVPSGSLSPTNTTAGFPQRWHSISEAYVIVMRCKAYTQSMGQKIAIIGIGLMVETVLPYAWMHIVGFGVFVIGAAMWLWDK